MVALSVIIGEEGRDQAVQGEVTRFPPSHLHASPEI